MTEHDSRVDAALDAISRGYQPIPVRPGSKAPNIVGWPKIRWEPDTTREQFEARMKEWGFEPGDDFNLGVNLGEASGHLVDVDIDYHRAKRFRDLLPRTRARSGRPGSGDSHWWYIVEGDYPSTRRYKLADEQTVTIELRYDKNSQTIIPPSDWVPKNWDALGRESSLVEIRNWEHEPWGGADGPARVNGRVLAVQVALVALATVVIDEWPKAGTRHDAYNALAGGLLRMADGVVHPFWERNAGVLIRAVADATLDDDGPDAREAEAVSATIRKIRDGKNVTGFPSLAKIIGDDQVRQIRLLMAEVESLAGFASRQAGVLPPTSPSTPPLAPGSGVTAPGVTGTSLAAGEGGGDPVDGEGGDAEPFDPAGTWQPVDLEAYLTGQVVQVDPTVLRRSDGPCLFYPGRLNMLFAPSESGKSFLAQWTAIEVMAAGGRVVYIDFEDEPVNTISRMRLLGATDDDLRFSFTYIAPDQPVADMQRDKWGQAKPTAAGQVNEQLLWSALSSIKPTLIVVDGMTSIYGLHGLDSNNSVETDVITSWLKRLTRGGESTVILIDHMSKSSARGSMPIGSQHKVAMVQGTLLQVWPITQPRPNFRGELELIVLKDRPGQVRKVSGTPDGKAQVAARVIIDSTAPGGNSITMTVDPPPSGTASAGSAAGTLQLALTQGRVAQKLQQAEDQEKLFLSAFDNTIGTSLKGPEIVTKIGALWKAAGWGKAGIEATRDRLVSNGRIMKTGGDRGPNVRYVLQVGLAPDTPPGP